MSDSSFSTVSGAEVTEDVWCDDYFVEYVRDSGMFQYMGKDENSIIQVKMELTQKAGDELTVTVFLRLVGAGVTGDNTLRGNEEAARNFGYKLAVDQVRNAVTIAKHEQSKSRHQLLKVYKTPLKLWSMEKLRDSIFSDMRSGHVNGRTAYASCSEAEKDTFVQANSDRVTFGELVSNYSSGDHDAALLTLDAVNDTFVPDTLALHKRRMKAAGAGSAHRIRPVKIMKREHWFVAFAPSLAFRDFETSSDMNNAHFYAANRGKGNPLFSGGDLTHRGVIVHEEESLDVVEDVGDGGTVDCAAIPVCGAQAHILAWKEKPHGIDDEWDYGNGKGVGIAEDRGSGRLMVVLWVASQPDA
jgi:N4-gp56 family major capsid protein